MQWLLDVKPPHVRMCLVYYRRALIGWSALDIKSILEGTSNKGVIAWTDERWRRRGVASSAVSAILQKYRVPKAHCLDVYSSRMINICDKFGYHSINIWE